MNLDRLNLFDRDYANTLKDIKSLYKNHLNKASDAGVHFSTRGSNNPASVNAVFMYDPGTERPADVPDFNSNQLLFEHAYEKYFETDRQHFFSELAKTIGPHHNKYTLIVKVLGYEKVDEECVVKLCSAMARAKIIMTPVSAAVVAASGRQPGDGGVNADYMDDGGGGVAVEEPVPQIQAANGNEGTSTSQVENSRLKEQVAQLQGQLTQTQAALAASQASAGAFQHQVQMQMQLSQQNFHYNQFLAEQLSYWQSTALDVDTIVKNGHFCGPDDHKKFGDLMNALKTKRSRSVSTVESGVFPRQQLWLHLPRASGAAADTDASTTTLRKRADIMEFAVTKMKLGQRGFERLCKRKRIEAFIGEVKGFKQITPALVIWMKR